jgi:hypothetical protein
VSAPDPQDVLDAHAALTDHEDCPGGVNPGGLLPPGAHACPLLQVALHRNGEDWCGCCRAHEARCRRVAEYDTMLRGAGLLASGEYLRSDLCEAWAADGLTPEQVRSRLERSRAPKSLTP